MRAAWWWIDRWRKSTAFTDMTAEEQGLYRNLLDEVVLRPDGIIPGDSLGKASGDAVAWQRCGQKVLKWMQRRGDGWTNETMLEVKAKGEKLSAAQREKAKARWDKKAVADAGAQAAADAGGNAGGDASVSVSVSVLRTPDPSPEPGTETDPPLPPQGGTPLSPRPAARKKRKDEPVHQQAPDVIHAYNDAFGSRLMDSNGNLRAASRALDAGYTLEQIREVFLAVRSRSTPTARWCCDNNRALDYLVRPPYKNRAGELTLGPLDKIPNELADRQRGPILSERTRRTADMLAEFMAEPECTEER